MCHFSPEFVHNVTLIAVHSPLQLCRQDIASLSILLCAKNPIRMILITEEGLKDFNLHSWFIFRSKKYL